MLVHAQKIDGSYDKTTYFVYLHGKVEDMNGFDCVYVEGMPSEPGRYSCEVKLEDKEETIPAIFFYWTAPWGKVEDTIIIGDSEDTSIRPDPENPGMLIKDRGLIVMVDDSEHLADADMKFQAREAYL